MIRNFNFFKRGQNSDSIYQITEFLISSGELNAAKKLMIRQIEQHPDDKVTRLKYAKLNNLMKSKQPGSEEPSECADTKTKYGK